MVTDTSSGPTRRQCLALLTVGAWWPASATPSATRLLACWDESGQHHIGLLQLVDEGLQVTAQLELPTRGHGVHAAVDGTCWVAARRPGEWLLRWHPVSGARQWHWVDDDRRLNGHVLPSPGGPIWTTESDQETGQGCIGVRVPLTLAKVDEWPSHGMDPHAMLRLPTALGPFPAGTLLVANGGIPTQTESGRSQRDMARMDPSLVAMDPVNGRNLGQWRLQDTRLSIRHLAWDPVGQRVGVALQAEHDDIAARRNAPLCATWDGEELQVGPPVEAGLGYAGDICARAGGGFWLSANLAHSLLALSPRGTVVARYSLSLVGALATADTQVWAAGHQRVWHAKRVQSFTRNIRLDNHWSAISLWHDGNGNSR